MHYNNEIELFYKNTLYILGLKSIPYNKLLYLRNYSLKNNTNIIYDNKQMISANDLDFVFEDSKIKFHPLNEQKESCSRLILNDSIHLYLRNLTYSMFKKIITIKDGTNTDEIYDKLNSIQLDKLSNPTKNTKYKYYNLFNIVSATSFSKNLISFSIDSSSSPKNAKVNFKYPLYDALCSIQNNMIFGIYLDDSEIKLFKQIYKDHIIDIINNIFQKNIDIPENSSTYPQFYILLKIKLILEETFWKEYNVCFIDRRRILKYNEMLSNLNDFSNNGNTPERFEKKVKKHDQEAYQNEIQIRKESEPNLLLLKDNEMGKNKQQPAVIENNKIGKIVDEFGNFLGSYNIKQYTNAINRLNTDMLVQGKKDNYQIWKNDQEWKDIFYLQNLILNILQTDGGALWYDSRIKKYCFRSKLKGRISEVDSKELGDLLARAFKKKIIHFDSNNNYNLLNYAMEVVVVSKLKGINNQKLSVNEKSNDIIKILLFENEIKTIDDDAFNLNMNNEFFKNHNDSFYTQNRFVSNKYLCHTLIKLWQ